MGDAIDFKEATHATLSGEGFSGMSILPVDGNIISCWKFTLIERIYILITGKIWMIAMGEKQPIVALEGNTPYEIKNKNGYT